MNTRQVECDDRQLLAMLRSDDRGADDQSLMNHVEQCSRCQHRLEALAATPADWKKAGDALSDDSWDNPTDRANGDPSRFSFSRWNDGSVSWTESMARQLLSPPSHPEMLGRLGRYEVERMIGAGGMGVVFKAFDSELNRPVAVKVLAPYLAGSGPARKRFAREARAAAGIVHEHVVPIHNVETERDAPFLVMQYIAGESLQTRIDRTGPLQTCEILRLGKQIASGLSAAHQQGLVHRDIKPSNILLEQGVERALITDFGLARAVDDATLTRSGFHPGTPQFMSPEQASGDSVDARSDLFSLGSVLYTMCTGRPPFRAESSLGVLRRITDDEPRRIRELNPSVPEWLCGIIGKLMAKRPSDRYRSAADVAVLLEQCLAHMQQPEFIPLPHEAAELQSGSSKFPRARFFHRKKGLPMPKVIVSVVALFGLLAAYCLHSPPLREAVAQLQGEWVLVASEREGNALPADQLFNERLVIEGTRFSRHQTAPDGREINGEKGKLSIEPNDSAGTIDFVLWEGTVHGLYKLNGDELTLCITRQGGARPDSFATNPGDSRVRQTFRRETKPDDATSQAGDRNRAWKESWLKRIPEELSGRLHRDEAEAWMRKHGFQDIVNAEITLEVMRRIHPGTDERAIQPDGVRGYLHGILRPEHADDMSADIEVYCLFGADDRMRAVQVGPRLVENLARHTGESLGDNLVEYDRLSRIPSPLSRPVMAGQAPILACLGPENPIRLGDMVSHSEIRQGLDPSVVRLHVWDWSRSDLSRILLIQRSELGALTPDGGAMYTHEGEVIDLKSKATRQYSGFEVPHGQRITALHVSPTGAYAAAMIHVRTEVDNIPTDPPTLDARHFWTLRLLKLDASTNTGHRIGEYAASARAGVAFTADESAIIHSTDQHGIVRRELPTGKILNTYEPSQGVHGAVGLAVSRDGRLVAAAGYHGTIYLWDTQTGALQLQYEALHPDGERDPFFKAGVLRFSPDGGKLAAVSGNHIKIIDVVTGTILREHRDATRPRYVHVHWSADARTITLLTSSQLSEYGSQPMYQPLDLTVPGRQADRLPRIYEWSWETGDPEVKQYPAADATDSSRIDPDLETRRLTGTWRIVDRSTAGVEQTAEIGTTVQIRHGRMGEVRLDLDPNQSPRAVDVVFLDGPERGKVLRGIYEWLPERRADDPAEIAGTCESLRICTFIEPHPDRPDERPRGFQAGKDVDTAIWECVSHDLPETKDTKAPGSGHSERSDLDRPLLPVDADDIERAIPVGDSGEDSEAVTP
jgi:uncharacterized protein (TIGR03067 family)